MEALIKELLKYYNKEKKVLVFNNKKEEFYINLLLTQIDKKIGNDREMLRDFSIIFGGYDAWERRYYTIRDKPQLKS